MTTVRHCPACDVAWARTAGNACWLCGAEGVETWLLVTPSNSRPDLVASAAEVGA